MNAHSGHRANSAVRGKTHHSFHFLPAIPRDYLARRRMFRNISNVLMIVLLSLIIAGVIIYTSDPNSFSFLRH
ncbi:MAG TPA: hypothetical protein VFR42_00760 [Candidatus Acidoferrum sp.]|nr:hypothetical protein [Candidatus Acidoferrum sp.]